MTKLVVVAKDPTAGPQLWGLIFTPKTAGITLVHRISMDPDPSPIQFRSE